MKPAEEGSVTFDQAMEEMHSCDFLVLLFCGTNGNNDTDLLGSDESDIVILVWQLLDLMENQTGDIHYIYVRPQTEYNLSDAWVNETRISADVLQSAIPLEEAIRQFEHTLRNELNDKGRTCKFFLCTDGQCHLRQVLHPTAMRLRILLPEFFYSFFDLRKEFRKCCVTHIGGEHGIANVDDSGAASQISVSMMMEYLNITVPRAYGTLGVDHVMKMGAVIQVLTAPKFNYKLVYPETIADHLETVPCNYTYEFVPDDSVVRARGLPWQSSDHDIARFFKGLNIERGGVALVLNMQGRRNGEALVRFVSAEHRNMALLRHKHHMGNRYIEVYKAKAEDFLKVATCNSREAVQFLSNGSDAIVRVRGLPFSAMPQDIIDFFGQDVPVANGKQGILLVRHPDGRASGDAFVLFESEEMAHKALEKHKKTLGKRYIEIFKSTAAEVQQVLNRHSANPVISEMSSPMHMPVCIPGLPMGHTQHAHLAQTPAAVVASPGAIRNCIRLRGMPYSATVEDIMQFLGELSFGILPNGIHMVLNQQGRPSGDAFIQMASPDKAALAALDVSKGGCHKKHMRERYVEVFQCSGDEMNMVLMGGTLNRNGVQPPPGMSLVVPEQLPVQRPTAATPSTYALPAASPTALMLHPPQLPIEMLHPQAILPPVAAHRQLYSQSILPYAYLPTPPVSPSAPSPAGAVQSLAAHGTLSPHVALAHIGHPGLSGMQVRMQGVSYNPAVSDILTLFKGYNPHQQQVYAATAANGCQSPLVEEKGSALNVSSQVVVGNGQPNQSANDWPCIA